MFLIMCSQEPFLDQEAYDRATSVYLVDRVVPMLPEVLSNELCSLRPNEDKFTFSAVFELNDKAEIQNNGLEERSLILTEDFLMKKRRKE